MCAISTLVSPPRPLVRTLFSLRSWAVPWRERRSGPAEAPGPRIAVIGNCQGRGLAAALGLLCPGSRVRLLPTGRLRRIARDADALAEDLRGSDLVLSQSFPDAVLPGGVAALRARLPQTRLFPTLVFPGFHPDTIYVGEDAALVPSPLGLYHSAIAAFGFLCGLDEARTTGLFREEVFARLGYLDIWDGAARAMRDAAAEEGFPLDRELLLWSRRGCFMLNVNHPKLFVLGDIARRLLAEAGLPVRDVDPETYLADDLLRDVVWPVYPPLAERYGVAGSYLFKGKASGAALPDLYDLPAFVAASFRIYRGLPRARLTGVRLETWAADAGLRALFAAA
ncbi:WcbI family polysaccharide biosynthesis putative acetyltransferase [Methylobacterium sp. ID0610]|uniref:WcbI family polysaccharide biosynthesis putative acetyltransferase n=1 Tax=Methylobacterium carpenticola TaxID=3344827 RepID=UPI003693047C